MGRCETQIPFGNDNKKSECKNYTQIPFGNDNKKTIGLGWLAWGKCRDLSAAAAKSAASGRDDVVLMVR